jgi:hypothetical protein
VRLEWPAALLVSTASLPAFAGQPTIAAERAVFPVRVDSGENGPATGVCVAIAREPSGDGHLIYFLTSARLVGSSPDWTAEIAVGVDTLTVTRAEALVDPHGRVAILRAISSRPIETAPLFLEHAPPESGVVAAGVRQDGTPGLVAARLHHQLPGSLVTLDTPDTIRLHAGAPVFIDRGLLAIASGRAAGAGVEVEELAQSRAFLLEQVPGVASSPPAAALFAQEDREFAGPTIDVPIGRTTRGEIEVPLDLGARETILGATARLVSRTPLNLGEVTVIALGARSVRLGFAIGGDPPPALAAPWPPGQALILVRVTLIASPSR